MSLTYRRKVKRSQAQERKIATENAGQRVAGSGNQASTSQKGDVRLEHWLGEAKYTDKTRYGLRLSDWRQIEVQAFKAGKEPIMFLEIAGRKLAVVDYEMWRALDDALHNASSTNE